jgi:hypothetical protein
MTRVPRDERKRTEVLTAFQTLERVTADASVNSDTYTQIIAALERRGVPLSEARRLSSELVKHVENDIAARGTSGQPEIRNIA